RRCRPLRHPWRHTLDLEAYPWPLQGLHSDAQVQHVPVASYYRNVQRGEATGDSDTDLRDGYDGGVRHRGPLDVQAWPYRPSGGPVDLAQEHDGVAERDDGCQ